MAAYARIGVRRPMIQQEHMLDAYNEINLAMVKFSNLVPNLWTVDLVTVPLIQGTTTYSVDPSTVMILDAYIGTGSPEQDRLIFPISRTEYSSYPNKTLQGFPSVFWFDRLISPTITIWQVPDQTGYYTLKYYRCTQLQDANLPNGEMPAVPYRWLDALIAEVAYRLARIHAPDKEQIRMMDADKAWAIVATNDVENTPLAIIPALVAYRN